MAPDAPDTRAVSTAVGVTMLVAVTVIIATVLATAMLNMGRQPTPEGPNIVVEFEYERAAAAGTTDSWGRNNDGGTYSGLLHLTHETGAVVPAGELRVRGVSLPSDGRFTGSSAFTSGSQYDSGDELTVWVPADATVRVVWTEPEGRKSTEIAAWDDGT